MKSAASFRQRPWRRGIRKLCLAVLAVSAISACVARPVPHTGTRTPREVTPGARLVAAGVLKGDMTTRSRVLHDLRITKVGTGLMTISFDGYRLPERTGGPSYLVVVEPVRVRTMVIPAVSIDSFASDGIVLRVSDPEGRMPLPLKYLVEHEFAIEVLEVPAK